MRIRSTKPEFWRSRRVASVSWNARLVLKGLESFVDDNGVGKHDVELIIGDLFQRDAIREPSRTFARVSEAVSELNQAGLLWLYEADGEELMFVAFWETFQRVDKPQPGRKPRPDGTLNYRDSEIRESPARPREVSRSLAPGTGEQGNRGTGDFTHASQLLVAGGTKLKSANWRDDEDDRERAIDDRHSAIADEQRARAAQADVERDAIDRCNLCDARGYAGGRVCEHDPDVSARARRGIDAARRAIGGDA